VRKISWVAVKRAALYLAISVFGMALLIGIYCRISGRTPLEAIENLWIALVFALGTAVVTALREQKNEDAARSQETGSD
jgi:magnesium-transporting ATPase (P-type)